MEFTSLCVSISNYNAHFDGLVVGQCFGILLCSVMYFYCSLFFFPIGESMPSTSRVFRCFGTEKTVSDKNGCGEKGSPLGCQQENCRVVQDHREGKSL